jgi:hypothetical protein
MFGALLELLVRELLGFEQEGQKIGAVELFNLEESIVSYLNLDALLGVYHLVQQIEKEAFQDALVLLGVNSTVFCDMVKVLVNHWPSLSEHLLNFVFQNLTHAL